jgi:hypothetical protein
MKKRGLNYVFVLTADVTFGGVAVVYRFETGTG